MLQTFERNLIKDLLLGKAGKSRLRTKTTKNLEYADILALKNILTTKAPIYVRDK